MSFFAYMCKICILNTSVMTVCVMCLHLCAWLSLLVCPNIFLCASVHVCVGARETVHGVCVPLCITWMCKMMWNIVTQYSTMKTLLLCAHAGGVSMYDGAHTSVLVRYISTWKQIIVTEMKITQIRIDFMSITNIHILYIASTFYSHTKPLNMHIVQKSWFFHHK